jgi:hypothetical protein
MPKAIRTRDRADATSAPAMIGVQWTNRLRTSTGPVGRSGVCIAVFLYRTRQRRPRNDRMNRITTIKPIR